MVAQKFAQNSWLPGVSAGPKMLRQTPADAVSTNISDNSLSTMATLRTTASAYSAHASVWMHLLANDRKIKMLQRLVDSAAGGP